MYKTPVFTLSVYKKNAGKKLKVHRNREDSCPIN